MPPDLWSLYSLMLKSRLFEEATAQLWREGLISGELHLGTGARLYPTWSAFAPLPEIWYSRLARHDPEGELDAKSS